MLINVPFKENPDNYHCIHAAMCGVIKHFTAEHYSLDYLNAFMNSDHCLWVWPFQAVKALDELGLFVRLYSQYNFANFKNINSIKTAFSDIYSSKTDIKALSESVEYINSHSLNDTKALTLMDIDNFLRQGCVPIILLGSKKHLGKYVVITGFDSKNFYYHESGPNNFEPNKKISKEKFLHLWSQVPSRNMAIIVYGKKFENAYTRFHF